MCVNLKIKRKKKGVNGYGYTEPCPILSGVFSAINFRLVLCSGRWTPYRLELEGLSEQRERDWVGGVPACPLPLLLFRCLGGIPPQVLSQ